MAVRRFHVARIAGESANALQVSVVGERGGHIIRLARDSTAVTIEGTWEQGSEVAAVVRATLPKDFPRVVLIDDSAAGYADVPAGASAASIASGWLDLESNPLAP